MPGGGESTRLEAVRLLREIAATPRAAGSEQERGARGFCASFLSQEGYSTREEPFAFSAFAGRAAAPLAGAILVAMFATVGHLGARDLPAAWLALALYLCALGCVGLFGSRWAILHLPWLRTNATNLEALAGAGPPCLWLMAHLDSKSQPISILARAACVAAVGIAAAVLIALMILEHVGQVPLLAWVVTSLSGAAGAAGLMGSFVSNRSNGAIDNASGVVALLLAARELRRRDISNVGIVLTSAEELALAGAHAWSKGRAPSMAINCDSVDDEGAFLCLVGRSGSGSVIRALRAAARARETPLRELRMLPGILVDSVALGARGWDTVTLARGSLRTLSRIHTTRDDPSGLHCAGIASAAELIVAAAVTLIGDSPA